MTKMERTIGLYDHSPVLVIYGNDGEIDSAFFDIGLRGGAYSKYIHREFANIKEAEIRNVDSPYGPLDVYIRVLEGNLHNGNIAMVITPNVANTKGIKSLQEIVETLRPRERVESPTLVPNLQVTSVQPV